jgi:protein TilB
LDFSLTEDDKGNILLDVPCGKYLDTSLIQLEVQPMWVRVIVKGRLLQLPFMEEVHPDKAVAKRSTVTGNLLVTIPKVKNNIVKPWKPVQQEQQQTSKSNKEVKSDLVDIHNIVPQDNASSKQVLLELHREEKKKVDLVDVDDSEVPPLE